MSDERSFEVRADVAARAHIDRAGYEDLYARSLRDPDGFWSEQADRFVTWSRKWDSVQEVDYRRAHIRWFEGGRLNVSYNCLDRHLAERGDQVAIIWEGDDPGEDRRITYRALHEEVCRFANGLKSLAVARGDRVCIYMPMIPEAVVAMLACARIGAVHSVVFGGFSAESLRDRINDSSCKVLITADEGIRGGGRVPLKANGDTACEGTPSIEHVVVVKRSGADVAWQAGRDRWYHELVDAAPANCPPEEMDAEDPLFILYTSGSTGKPKGVLHSCGGYLLYTAMTHRYVFDYHDGDVYWCTADVGWVTGHSYIVYGPLANGATTLVFEGVPTYPDAGRFWQVVDKHAVNIFYTAPTAIRALMQQGDAPVLGSSRASLRLLGTVGEPINPEAWEWYHRVIGGGCCPIVDTWWQTETGSIMVSPLPGSTPLKPGSGTFALPGIDADVVDMEGNSVPPGGEGYLVVRKPWPSMFRTLWGDPGRFIQTYWSQIPGIYFVGDAARRDEDGYLWVLGRVDDVMNVSGHRLSTAELESTLVRHDSVAEAAVVGMPDELTGQAVIAFVTPIQGYDPTDELAAELREWVAQKIGKFARPKQIRFSDALPKTRSGKIMRRLLREIVTTQTVSGDITTLEDLSVINRLGAQQDEE